MQGQCDYMYSPQVWAALTEPVYEAHRSSLQEKSGKGRRMLFITDDSTATHGSRPAVQTVLYVLLHSYNILK